MSGRQSIFPGIFIRSITIETPPFDEPGVIQDFVGRGLTNDFDMLQKAADFSEENVGKFIQEADDIIGPLRDTFRIKYNLRVRTIPLPGVINPLNERGVSLRGRTFVRAKNPFEPDIIEIEEPTLNETLSAEDIGNVYNVTVTVTK